MKTKTISRERYPIEKNKVLDENYRISANFYQSDKILKNYLMNDISDAGRKYMNGKLEALGKDGAGIMNELSLLADKFTPQLVKRNHMGEEINEIRFHPSYNELLKIAVKSGMFRVKWEPSLKEKFREEKHRLGFSAGYIYAMSECGIYCPLCMTDGVARLIDLFCEDEDKNRLLPHIFTEDVNDFFTGAMYLTEKTGGSDVGANITVADPSPALPDLSGEGNRNLYLLTGEKWFCSNANADLIFALARTDSSLKGTKGLSIFLIEKKLPSGERNPIEIIRIKDKLGVRSMATAECMLNNTVGKLVGSEFNGFKVMTEMINLSRLYNSVAALACSRRALIEAYQFLSHRNTFGKMTLDHALIRIKFTELGALNVAGFYLVWRAIKALDLADTGNAREKELFRFINPITKKWTAENGVYITRESMELMGGLGYIEDTVMPKLMRDVMVLPIWEGSGNVIVLDMLRAMEKSKGFEILCEDITVAAKNNSTYGKWMSSELEKLVSFSHKLNKFQRDKTEAYAKPFFEKLTSLYQVSLLINALNEESKEWILPALDYLKEKYSPSESFQTTILPVEEVRNLVGWEF